jgi:DNA-binding transcriptional ArsR family regulator
MAKGRPGAAGTSEDFDLVWKALADPTRRSILDQLRGKPCTTTQVVERFPELSRFGVMKHLAVLRAAGLVLTREEGRQVVNTLNVIPIRWIYERWVSDYQDVWVRTLSSLKRSLESPRDDE